MQTQTNRRSRKPKEYSGPIIYSQPTGKASDYIQAKDSDYISYKFSELDHSEIIVQTLALQEYIRSETDFLNTILKQEQISAVHTKQYKAGLKAFQDATNQLLQLDLKGQKLTLSQVKEIKQIYEAYNKAFKSQFPYMFEKDPKQFQERFINQGRMNVQGTKHFLQIASEIYLRGRGTFGENLRFSDLAKTLGKYVPHTKGYYIKKYEAQHQEYNEFATQRPDWRAVRKQSLSQTIGVERVDYAKVYKQSLSAKREEILIEHNAQHYLNEGVEEHYAVQFQVADYIRQEFGLSPLFVSDAQLSKWISEFYMSGEDYYVQQSLAQFWAMTDNDLGGEVESLASIIIPRKYFELLDAVKSKILAHDKVTSIITSLNFLTSAQASAVSALQETTDEMRKGYQGLESVFDDLFTFPLNQLGVVMNMASQGLNMAGKAITLYVGSMATVAGNFIKSAFPKEQDDDTKKSIVKRASDSIIQITKQIINTISSIISIFAQGIQLIQSVISLGIQAFTTMFTMIFGILRKVLSTSKTIDQIMNIISLSMSVFFLPVILVFGDGIFKQVLQFIDWIYDENGGQALLNLVSSYADLQEPILESIDGVFLLTPKILDTICSFLVLGQELFRDYMPVLVGYFKNFLNGEDGNKVIEMCKLGLEIGTILLENGIIQLFIKAGQQGIGFLYAHKEEIFNILKTSVDVLLKQLTILADCNDRTIKLIMDQGLVIGAIVGAIINILLSTGGTWGISSLISIFGPKQQAVAMLESVLFTKAGWQSLILGGQGGVQIGHFIATNFFNFGEKEETDTPSYLEGGYIPQTPGGYLIRVAEKETEYIIPESKIHLIRGHNNILIEINGDVYGIDERVDIPNAINEVSNQSRFR